MSMFNCIKSQGVIDLIIFNIVCTGVPGRPTEVATSDFKSNKVKISWTLGRDNYSPVTKVHIFYRTQYEKATWRHFMTTMNIKTRGTVEASLSPWASYRFRVISENAVGNSTPSTETFPWLKSSPAGWLNLKILYLSNF